MKRRVIYSSKHHIGSSQQCNSGIALQLGNKYCTNYSIGDTVRFYHGGDSYSDETGTIVGFDSDGFYVIEWPDHTTSEGISDDNVKLASLFSSITSSSVSDVSGYVPYCKIADYIHDNYRWDDIDDKYSCIESLQESFKGEDFVATDVIEQFVGAHNGEDIEDSKDGEITLGYCPNCGSKSFNDHTGLCTECGYDESAWGDVYSNYNPYDYSTMPLPDDDEYNYQLLGRLQLDCDMYLNNPNPNKLWAKNVPDQIAMMRKVYDAIKNKPDWITPEDIDEYEILMTN